MAVDIPLKLSRWIVALAVCAVAGSATDAQTQPSFDREYQIKAAFLYNFLKFVDWPGDVLPEAGSTITMCLLGEDPFGDALEPIRGKSVRGKNLVIRRVERAAEVAACHLLFISSSEGNRFVEILRALRGTSVLTVGELEGFTARGGIIRLFIERNTVRFEINTEVAERARLKISSRLLSLAKIVKG